MGDPRDHRAQPARPRGRRSRLGLPGPTHDDRTAGPSTSTTAARDPVLGIARLRTPTSARYPDYATGITVPAMVDVPTGQVVTNDFPRITHDLFFEWPDHHRPTRPTCGRTTVRDEMEEVMERVFTEVNNGVYRCGFAGDPGGVRRGVRPALDRPGLARGAARRPPLPDGRRDHRGRRPAVHHAGPLRRGLPRPLQVQPQKLTEMPDLWGYARDLFQTPASATTTDFEQIKQHYYVVHTTSTRPASCRRARIRPGG